MPRRLVMLLVFVIVCIGATVRADDSTPRLHIPTLEKYLESAEKLWNARVTLPRYREERFSQIFLDEHLSYLLQAGFEAHYADSADSQTLLDAYTLFNQGRYMHSMHFHFLPIRRWNQRIVKRLLHENQVQLEAVESVSLPPYELEIQRHFFTNTAQADVLLKVYRGDYFDYWMVTPTEDGYDFYGTPFQFYESDYTSVQGRNPDLSPWPYATDLTMDGREEWVVRGNSGFPGNGYIGNWEELTVYYWQAGDWVKALDIQIIAPNDYLDDYPLWEFENIDADTALEVIEVFKTFDNLGCFNTETVIYDWDGTVYSEVSRETEFTPTVPCAVRLGQIAMFDKDYAAAIEQYQTALERFAVYQPDPENEFRYNIYIPSSDRFPATTVPQLAAYAQERLFIAYLLNGQADQAIAMRDSLADIAQNENTLARQFLALPRDLLTAEVVCRTAFEFIGENFGNDEQYYRELSNVGLIDDTFYTDRFGYVLFLDPARVGCDWPSLHTPVLQPTDTPTPHPRRTPTPREAFDSALYDHFSQMGAAHYRGQIANALPYADAILAGVGEFIEADVDYVLVARLYRAMALEALGRTDEAVLEYQIVHQTAPHSLWGLWAGMWLN